MALWATVLTLFGLLYLFWAGAWHRLFNRETVRHAERDESGYRIGRLVYWRPPGRILLMVIGLSIGAIVTVILFDDFLETLLLIMLSATLASIWLLGTPGQRLVYAEADSNTSRRVFELTAERRPLRSTLVLLALGLLPALGLGLILSDLLTRLIPGFG